MNPLVTFQRDKTTKETVKNFMISQLEEMAIDKVFTGESVVGIKEAGDLVEKAFNKLDELYGEKKRPNVESKR